MPFLHTAYEITDVKGKLIKAHKQRNGNLNQQLIYGNSLSCLGVFIKKEILIQHPFIERRELSGSEDYELWMRLASIYPIAYSDKVTAAIIQHEERSVINFSSGKLIRRIELVIEFLVNNKMFIAAYGKQLNIFIAHRFLYLSLHLIMGRHYLLGLKYWMKAFWAKPTIVLTRKSVGIFKNLFISFYSK
jgi:hypothetical protein